MISLPYRNLCDVEAKNVFHNTFSFTSWCVKLCFRESVISHFIFKSCVVNQNVQSKSFVAMQVL